MKTNLIQVKQNSIQAPVVSIIVPCYNDEKYIEETLDSILRQSFSSWECIIINDGSKDTTETLVLNKIKFDKRFNYIYQNNTGVCIARNNAIKKSIGQYILCLDADDLISNNFLEETVNLLDLNSSLNIATSTVNFFGRSKGVLKVVSYDLDILLAANQIVMTSLFRRVDFDKVGGFNENMKDGFEDWDFWISVLKNGGNVTCAKQAVFYYRLQNKSRNRLISFEKEKRLRYQIWNNHKELFSEYFVDPVKCFEYIKYADSMEYKIGSIILNPVRKIKFWIVFLKEKFNLI